MLVEGGWGWGRCGTQKMDWSGSTTETFPKIKDVPFSFLRRAGESVCVRHRRHIRRKRSCCRSCVTLSENDTSSILCLFQAQGLHAQPPAR